MILNTYIFSRIDVKIVNIEMNINIEENENESLRFTVKNFDNCIQKYLIKASNIFAKFHKNFFKHRKITITVSSSEKYSIPFITSVFIAGYLCKLFNVEPPKVIIIGDILSNGGSINFDYSILKKHDAIKDYVHWDNLSYFDIEKKISAKKIYDWWKIKRKNKEMMSIIKQNNIDSKNLKFILYL